MKLRQFFAAASLGLSAAVSFAAPITFEFAGVLTGYGHQGTVDPSKIGKTFSGTYTIDLANIEVDTGATVYEFAGCTISLAGVCKSEDFGNNAAVVTDWSFNFEGQLWGDLTGVVGSRATSLFTSQISKRMTSDQQVVSMTTDPGQIRFMTSLLRLESFSSLWNLPLDPSTVPDIAGAEITRMLFQFNDKSCEGVAFSCTGTLTGEDLTFVGTLTTWQFLRFEPDANNVPEPGSLALIGIGLAGMAAVRRRKG